MHLSLSLSLSLSFCWSCHRICILVGQFNFAHHSDQMSQRSQVFRITLCFWSRTDIRTLEGIELSQTKSGQLKRSRIPDLVQILTKVSKIVRNWAPHFTPPALSLDLYQQFSVNSMFSAPRWSTTHVIYYVVCLTILKYFSFGSCSFFYWRIEFLNLTNRRGSNPSHTA